MDANDAGGRNSEHCTLILTEGDSAKSLVVGGLSVAGRDRFGVFPLRCGMMCQPHPVMYMWRLASYHWVWMQRHQEPME